MIDIAIHNSKLEYGDENRKDLPKKYNNLELTNDFSCSIRENPTVLIFHNLTGDSGERIISDLNLVLNKKSRIF